MSLVKSTKSMTYITAQPSSRFTARNMGYGGELSIGGVAHHGGLLTLNAPSLGEISSNKVEPLPWKGFCQSRGCIDARWNTLWTVRGLSGPAKISSHVNSRSQSSACQGCGGALFISRRYKEVTTIRKMVLDDLKIHDRAVALLAANEVRAPAKARSPNKVVEANKKKEHYHSIL